jgi:hypothetical protein
LVFAFLGLAACEPMTEEEMAAFQQQQQERRATLHEEAAERAVFCEGDIRCFETQKLVAEQCMEMARNRFTFQRSNQYGVKVSESEVVDLSFYNFNYGFMNPNAVEYGGNNIISFYATVRHNRNNHREITTYDTKCIIRIDSTDIIDIEYNIYGS